MFNRGFFISLEGIAKTGKSTQHALLHDYFDDNNIPFKLVFEPGATKLGNEIRTLVMNASNDILAYTELLLFSASRYENIIKNIRPALATEHIVVADRFIDSTIAYQAFGKHVGVKPVEAINRLTVGDIIPDLTFIFLLPPEGIEARLNEFSDKGRFHNFNVDTWLQIQRGYEYCIKNNPERCIGFDVWDYDNETLKPAAYIHKQIIDTIESNVKYQQTKAYKNFIKEKVIK